MKKSLFAVAFLSLVLLICCGHKPDTIVGTWKVANVSVGFDEYKYTPDMVRQIGLAEKSNVIVVEADSTLIYVSGGDTLRKKAAMKNGDLYLDGEKFAVIQKDTITETKKTVLGDVVIKYTKQ